MVVIKVTRWSLPLWVCPAAALCFLTRYPQTNNPWLVLLVLIDAILWAILWGFRYGVESEERRRYDPKQAHQAVDLPQISGQEGWTDEQRANYLKNLRQC